MDARAFADHRVEPERTRTKVGRWLYALGLPFFASEYLGLALYRFRVSLRAVHVPVLPTLINWCCAIVWGIRIGDNVLIEEGVYIPHGQIMIDGHVWIGRGCTLCPWISVGLVEGTIWGPHLGDQVFVGTGARILGPLTVGHGARIGANAVVLSDVPANATAVGVPARIIPQGHTEGSADSAQTPSNKMEDSTCAPS